jgi:hypothetical protein
MHVVSQIVEFDTKVGQPGGHFGTALAPEVIPACAQLVGSGRHSHEVGDNR